VIRVKTKGISVSTVTITAFAHSTEDELKVIRALLNVLPPNMREISKISTESVTGYYGDKITVIRTQQRQKAVEILQYVLRSLTTSGLKEFLQNLEERMDGSGNLYIRLSKQKAFLGFIELQDSDPIRLKLQMKKGGSSISPQDLRRNLMDLARMSES